MHCKLILGVNMLVDRISSGEMCCVLITTSRVK